MSEPHPRNPIAALADPGTSHEAAREITKSGKRDAQAQLVLNLVRTLPGWTSAELARSALAQFDRYAAARRLPELEKLGLVRKGAPKKCGVTGRNAVTWWPSDDRKPEQGDLF